jgi:hypothetical protein
VSSEVDLLAGEIPQRPLQELFELDADYAEALWALDQPAGSLDRHAMLRDTLAALQQLPKAATLFRRKLLKVPRMFKHPSSPRPSAVVLFPLS